MLLLGTQDVLGSRIIPEFSNPTNNTLLEQRKYSYTEASGDLFCRPFGECEPCPKDERDQPFCRPFGNRRLVHCIPKGQADPQDPYASEIEVDIPTRRQESGSATHSQKESPVLVGGSSRVIDMGSVQLGEVPAWEACGKVLAIERAGYWEFVVINTLLLTLSLVVLLVRSNSLAAHQYKQLAARIGIAGGGV